MASYEAGETFVQFLIVQIDGLLNTFKQILTPRNIDALISIVATELTIRLERAIKKCSFNRVSNVFVHICKFIYLPKFLLAGWFGTRPGSTCIRGIFGQRNVMVNS